MDNEIEIGMEVGMTTGADTPGEENKPSEAVAAQVKMWCARVKHAKEQHADAFEQMREDQRFARGLQWPDQQDLDDPRYVVNIVQRHLRQREAALYAKNPKAVAHRRQTLDFEVWDSEPQSLTQAQQVVMMAQQVQAQMLQTGVTPPGAQQIMMQAQEAQALIADYQTGMQRRQMLDRMAKTLEIVWQHQTGEQQPPFKASMKQLVRRVLTTGVGYLKLGYHRFSEYQPSDVSRVTDLTEQVATLEASLAEMAEDSSEYDETSAQYAELQNLLEKVTQEQESFVREGLDFDFPRSTSVIVDPDCYQLDGFLGARWVAQEFLLTPKQVHSVYGRKLDNEFTHYSTDGKEMEKGAIDNLLEEGKEPDSRALVWEVWDKHQGQTFTVCAGHPGFLVEPKTPEVYIERFWPFFVLTFNGLEDEENLYPPSDVRLIRHQQIEMNLMRQRLREHRDAARPGHLVPKGRLDEQDKAALEHREAHQVIELNGLAEQDDVRRILQPIPTTPIDPNQYDVNQLQDDVYKTVGTQEAVLGGTSGATATETSIAESSRLSAIGSAVDELDDFLTQVARSTSHLLLSEMSREKAIEISGPGGVWPELSGAEVAKDLWLEVRAGSSGRPNKSAELQNLERMLPFIMQMPNVKPKWVLEQVVERLDDRIDPLDAFDAAVPSMAAMNRQATVSGGDPGNSPEEQDGEGAGQTAVAQGDSNMGPRTPSEPRVMDPNNTA